MAMTVFDLEAVLKLNSSDYDAGLNTAEGKANSFGSKVGSTMATLGKVSIAALAGATTATVAFGKKSVEVGMTFDSSMSQVAATLGKTMQEMENEVGSTTLTLNGQVQQFNGTLREFAQVMGANTAFTASQAADALNYMALAGYDAQKSMDMLPNVLNLAAAGNMDLARASDMVTDAQTALGLEIPQVNEMVDQMAKTASTTNTSVEQLGDAILTIGGTARFMSGGTEELNSVLGVLADNGIKGSEAGTHLRNMLLKLSAPTETGANLMEDLGLKVYDAEGKMRSFEDIFTDLGTAMKDFTEEQKVQTFSDLFNARDVASATALLNTTTQRWHEVKGAIDDSSGAAAQMAETQLDNLNGDITIFKSALEGAQIVLSDQLTPDLRQFVQFGTKGIQDITKGFQEGGLAGAMSALGDTISNGLSMALGKSSTIINAALSLIESLAGAIRDNAPALLSAAKDVVIQVLEKLPTLVDITADIILAVTNGLTEALPDLIPVLVDTVNKLVLSLSSHLGEILSALGTLLTTVADAIFSEGLPIFLASLPDLINALVEFIVQSSAIITEAVVQIAIGIVKAVPEIVAAIVPAIPEIIAGIAEALAKHGPELSEAMMELTILSLAAVPAIIVLIVGKLPEIFKGIGEGIKKHGPKIKDAFVSAFNGFADAMADSSMMSMIFTGLGDLLNTIGDTIVGYKDTIVEHVGDWITGIGETFTNAFEYISGKVTEFFAPAVEAITKTWTAFMETFGPLINAFKYLFDTIFGAIRVIIQRAMELIKINIESVWNSIVAFVTPIIETIKNVVQTGFELIRKYVFEPLELIWGKVEEVWNNISTKVTEVLTTVWTAVSGKFEEIRSYIADKSSAVLSKITEVWDGIKTKITEVVGNATSWGKDLIENFVSGITNNVPNLASAVTGAADTIHSMLHFSEPDKGPLSDFSTYAPDMMRTFAQGIADNENLVTDQIDKSFNFGNIISRAVPKFNGMQFAGAGGPIQVVCPVYIGTEHIETIVVDALNDANDKSGGR